MSIVGEDFPGFSFLRPDDPRWEAEVLAVVAARANALVAGRPAAAVGRLSVTVGRYPNEARWWPQIRSEPSAVHGGAEFRFQVPSCGGGIHPAELLGEDLVGAAWRFAVGSTRIADVATDTRRIVDAAGREHPCPSQPPKLTATGIGTMQPMVDMPVVELELLGHNLSLGIDRVEEEDPVELADRVRHLLADHARRAGMLAAMSVEGERGMIADTSRFVIAAAGLPLRTALASLQRRSQLDLPIGDEGSGAWLRWHEGVLKADFLDETAQVRLVDDELTLFGRSLPEAVVAALPGRRLERALSHRLLSPQALILEATLRGRNVEMRLTCPAEPIKGDRIDLASAD